MQHIVCNRMNAAEARWHEQGKPDPSNTTPAEHEKEGMPMHLLNLRNKICDFSVHLGCSNLLSKFTNPNTKLPSRPSPAEAPEVAKRQRTQEAEIEPVVVEVDDKSQ